MEQPTIDIDRLPSLTIDRHNLDEEIARQPVLFYQVAEAHADAISLREESREEIKAVRGRLDADLREKLASKGTRPTADAVNAAIDAHPLYKKARAQHLAYSTLCDKLAGMREAWMQRSFALSRLADMAVSGYAQTPSFASDQGSEFDRESRTRMNREALNTVRPALRKKRSK